ncbi:hypothetical protein ABT119_05970 [Streptomyces sp. NPDC001910]|uniref:hypothetical protein n=1 Tax=Streptomyces sp. NPDC001910 TaxID=3154403 RepID=UPI00331CAF61
MTGYENGGHLDPGLAIAFELGGLSGPPAPDDALAYGRLLAERSGATIADTAQPQITQRSDGSDHYRVEIPATFT